MRGLREEAVRFTSWDGGVTECRFSDRDGLLLRSFAALYTSFENDESTKNQLKLYIMIFSFVPKINFMAIRRTIEPRELCVEETAPLRTVFRASSAASVFDAAYAATCAARALWQATLAATILDARSTGTAAP